MFRRNIGRYKDNIKTYYRFADLYIFLSPKSLRNVCNKRGSMINNRYLNTRLLDNFDDFGIAQNCGDYGLYEP